MPSENEELVVALFDVLGFEDRIGRISLDQIHAQYKELIAIATKDVSHIFFDARPAGDGTYVPFLAFVGIDHDYFSDTVLLWTKFRPHTLKPFFHVCSMFLCQALNVRLPMRGAVSIGPAIMDKSTRTYLGQPLVEAARAEKAQQWVGLALGRSFSDRRDAPLSADIIRPYTKHRKPGGESVVLELAVDWPRTWRKECNSSAIPLLEHLAHEGSVRDYYVRAVDFVRESDNNPEWYRNYQPNTKH